MGKLAMVFTRALAAGAAAVLLSSTMGAAAASAAPAAPAAPRKCESTTTNLVPAVQIAGLSGELKAGGPLKEFTLHICNDTGTSWEIRPLVWFQRDSGPELRTSDIIFEVVDGKRTEFAAAGGIVEAAINPGSDPTKGFAVAAHTTTSIRVMVGFARGTAPGDVLVSAIGSGRDGAGQSDTVTGSTATVRVVR